MEVSLRTYQHKGISQLYQSLRSFDRVIWSMMMGLGKTRSFIYLAKDCASSGMNVVIVMRRRELIKQTSASLDCFGIEHGVYMAGHQRFIPSRQIQVCSIDTLDARKKYPHEASANTILIVDECFPKETYIVTELGLKSISKLISMQNKPLALSFNESTGKYEYKKILNIFRNSKRDKLIEIRAGISKIRCTHNHKILTCEGYKKAEDIEIDDALLSSASTSRTVGVLTDMQIPIFVGSFFGDGGVSRVSRYTYRIRVRHDEKTQGRYCEFKAKCFGAKTIIRENRGYSKNMQRSFSTPSYYIKTDNIFDWCLERIDPISLAIWFMDDGSMCKKNFGTRLHTESFTVEQNTKIVKKLKDKFNIEPKIMRYKNGKYYYLSFLKKDRDNLYDVIKNYIHDDCAYKLLCKTKNDIPYGCSSSLYFSVVKEKRTIKIKEDYMYDLEVEGNHNYIVSSSKSKSGCGTVVHNCHDVTPKGNKYRSLIEKYHSSKIIGFTATPYSDNSLFQSIISPIEPLEALEQGYLTPVRPFVPNVIDVSKVTIKKTGQFSEEELFDACSKSEVVGNIVRDWIRYGEGRRTVLYAVNIAHSKMLCDAFIEAGIPSVHCDASTKSSDRDIAIRKLENDEIKVLCNVNLFSTGVDIPSISCIIFARPTRSLIYYLQAIGRGIRISPNTGKTDCVLIDSAGNYLRFGSPYKKRDAHIGKSKPAPVGDIEDISIRTCKQCFYVFDAKEKICPNCNFINPPIVREIKTREGELIEYELSDEELEVIKKKNFKTDFFKLKWVAEARVFKKAQRGKDRDANIYSWVINKLEEKYGVSYLAENKKEIPSD